MKNILLIVLWVMMVGCCWGQAGNWVWAKSAGGNNSDSGRSIATDASGNIYVIGFFISSTIIFGNDTLVNSGNNDMFIVKYDATGIVLWAKSAGGNLSDYAYSVTTDASGDIYVVGYFFSTSITFGSTILINSGSLTNQSDIFIVKYDSNGTVLWAKREGGPLSECAYAIKTDISENVYVTGYFNDSIIVFSNDTLINTGGTEMFIVKYNATGNVLWAKAGNGNLWESGSAIATDTLGNVFLSGSFWGSFMIFDSFILTNNNTGNFGDFQSVFIVKYDSTGLVQWAKNGTGDLSYTNMSLVTDASNNLYITGTFNSPALTFNATTLVNLDSGHNDMYIVKFNSSGTIKWTKTLGATDEYTSQIVSDGSSIYLTGDYESPICVFDTIILTNTDSSANSEDIFVVKYDSTGTALWAKGTGTNSYDQSHSIAIDDLGNIYITGDFLALPMHFDSILVPNAGDSDMFIAKIGSTLNTVNIPETQHQSSLTLYPNPSNGTFEIKSTIKIEGIKIMDVLGCEILKQVQNNQRVTVDMSGVAKGIYFVQVMDENKEVYNRKVVVE